MANYRWLIITFDIKKIQSKLKIIFFTISNMEAQRTACVNGDLSYVKANTTSMTRPDRIDGFIYLAAENGHLPIIVHLNKFHGNRAYDNEGCILAAENGHLHVVEYYFNRSRKYLYVDPVLHVAARKGHLNIVKFLVENGVDVNSSKNFALSHSSYRGDLETVKYLIEAGADLIEYNHEALRLAAYGNHLSVVEFLVEEYEKRGINWIELSGNYLLVTIVTCPSYFETMEYLLRKGCVPQWGEHPIEIPIDFFKRFNRYVELKNKNTEKRRNRAQKKIYFWWIQICYSLEHPSGCGQRMREKNLQKFLELCEEIEEI